MRSCDHVDMKCDPMSVADSTDASPKSLRTNSQWVEFARLPQLPPSHHTQG